MAPAVSEDEQVMQVDAVSAAPDPEQQQERDVKVHQDSERKKAAEDKLMLVLTEVQALRTSISQVLGPAGPRRVVNGDATRRCLAFMETELSTIAAFLTTMLSPQHWGVLELQDSLWDVVRLGSADSDLPNYAERVLSEVDPSRPTMLRRALQCFHHRKSSYSYLLLSTTVRLYHISGRTSRYRHLLQTSSDLVPTPQLAEPEEGALPLVGIDRPAKKILRWLTHQGKKEMNLRVMSIVGPVGIGKTTLAVELHNRLRQHEISAGRCLFQCNVMAQASRGTDRNIRLLQDILSQVSEPPASALSSNPSQDKTMEVLVHLVSEHLRHKRYFIIIDDMHKASDWEEIKEAFPADSNNLGSRILITTRVTSIAEACCSSYSCDGLVHKMKPLNEMESERLLLAKAVGSEDGCLPDNMKLCCDEILKRCDGIPLFIIGMADWLKEQLLQQLHQREDEENQRFAMNYEEQVPRLPERLEQALSSAFNDFPSDGMRSVLLYMSMFPYGYKFEKDRLMFKWIYEGFTHYDPRSIFGVRDATSKAGMFFSQLVDRNAVTCVASNCTHKQDEGEDCRWQVNHFMQQFLASKCVEMGFIFTSSTLKLLAASAAATTDHGNGTSSRMLRRLSLHHPDPQLASLLETMDLSQTRSLFVSGTVGGIPLETFVNLVVLDLEGWQNLKDEDLLQVCRSKMFFLSYLSIRNTRVHKLPREIKELQMLRTLDVSYTQISELPLELFELTDLFHLDLRGTRISQLPKQIVGLRDGLTSLLVGGGAGTINSVETVARVPHDVRHIDMLQTLATVDLTEHPASFVRAIGDLHRLRVILFTWSFHQSTDRDYCEALRSSIVKWRRLESLTIHCGLGGSMEFLGSLEGSGAPLFLKKFKVTAARFARVPQWIHGLRYLAFVQITVCNKQTTTDDLKILGDLPKLQCLILGLDFIPGQAIEIENRGFSKLHRFSVDCVLPWLTFQTGAMPWLTHLRLKFSSGPAVEDHVPSGISSLPRISEVVLSYSKWCVNSTSVKMTVKAVREQVAKHHNPIDFFINDEEDDVQAVDEEAENATGTSSSATDAGLRDDAQAVNEEEAKGVVATEFTDAEN